jgi:putative DNA-invertase from lambdoid prophage Rac
VTAYGYSRTSLGPVGGQDGMGQLFRLTESGILRDNIFVDAGQSGMKTAMSRPEFARMNAVLIAGDSVTVPELSRVGRSVRDVLGTMEDFESRGIVLKILDLGLDLSTPVGRMVATVLASISRLERDFISSRTRDSLAAKKAAGVTLGAPRRLTPAQENMVRVMRDSGMKPSAISEAMNVSVRTIYNTLSRTALDTSQEAATG